MSSNQGTRKMAFAMIAAGLLAGIAATEAAGQVVFTGTPGIDFGVWHGESELNRGEWDKSVLVATPPTATLNNNTLSLRMDLTLLSDMDDRGRIDMMEVDTWQSFTVTDLPVAVSLNLTGDIDLINGGGAAGRDPGVTSRLRTRIGITAYRMDNSYAGSALDTIIGPYEAIGNTPQDVFITFDHTTETFALAPGYRYTLSMSTWVVTETPSPLPSSWMAAGTTIEAGPLSGNQGLELTMNWTTLPEPALATLATPALLLLRRRRMA